MEFLLDYVHLGVLFIFWSVSKGKFYQTLYVLVGLSKARVL